MKMMWETPVTHVEEFVTDQYCTAVCFSLSCSAGPTEHRPDGYTEEQLWGDYTNTYDSETDTGWYVQSGHSTSGTGNCYDSSSNAISIDEDGNITVREKNGEQGWLTGILTGKFDVEGTSSGFGYGDLFSWVTIGAANDKVASDDNRVWRHWAYAGAQDPSAPYRHS